MQEIINTSASEYNETFHDQNWLSLIDFTKYNPGAKHRRRLTISLIKKIQGPIDSYADIGCGPCDLIQEVIHKSRIHPKKILGIDISNTILERNRLKFKNIDFKKIDISKESLPPQFDLITMSEVIEHIEDRLTALKNINQMLNPGGHLIITCPTGKVFPTEKLFGHTTHPTVLEIQELAQKSNFQVVKIQQWGFPFYLGLKIITNINPEFAIKNFGSGQYSFKQKFISYVFYMLNFFNMSNSMGPQLFVSLQKNHTEK